MASISTKAATARYLMATLLMAAFIVYGSLYPFDFSVRNGPAGPFALLASTLWEWDHGTDLVSNIIFYAPLGFFAIGSLGGVGAQAWQFIFVVIAGTSLSISMELLQFYDAGRVTSVGDVDANAIGTAVGAIFGLFVYTPRRSFLLSGLSVDPIATLLVASWFGYRLYPYVPAADLQKYWHAVRGLVQAPSLEILDLMRFTLTWLLIGCMVERVYGLRRWVIVFPLLFGAELVSRVLIINNELKLADIVGGLLAGSIWVLVLRWLPGRSILLAIAFSAIVCALRLAPFTFSIQHKEFGWVPFLSFMSGSMGVAIQAFLEKVFLYGGMIWLLRQAVGSLIAATIITITLLFVTSYMETFLPGRSAEMTDAAMAAVIGFLFSLDRQPG